MRTDPEQASRTRGIFVSVLLHALFLAGCLALDAGGFTRQADKPDGQARVRPVELPAATAREKS